MAFKTTAHTWMDLEVIMLSEIRQTENDKYCMASLICGITNQMNKHNKTERAVDTENKQVVLREKRSGLMREIGERDEEV